MNLFHSVDASQRSRVFVAMLEFAVKANELGRMRDQLAHLDQWFGQWKLDKERQRKIYRLLMDAYKG